MSAIMHGNRRAKGFTLVELIVTVTILAVMAGTTAGIVLSLLQMVVYLPKETRARLVAQEALYSFIEGDRGVMGLRYANMILAANSTSVSYRVGYPYSGDIRDVELALNGAKPQRRYTDLGSAGSGSYGSWETVPYYITPDINITGLSSGAIFSYFKSDGTAWTASGTPPTNLHEIRRVDIGITVTTGAGLFKDWEASFRALSGVDIKQYR